ncbi:MAG: RecX family transcriptional regulator [Myxococcota bacterium]
MAITRASERGPRARRRAPVEISREALERAALAHLERYDSSAANLRVVLRRRLARWQDGEPRDAARAREAEGWVDEIVADLVARRVVDDRRYAEALARRLARRASSHGATLARLRAKGVAGDVAREVAGERADPEAELAAATAYARRRGLGPFRATAELREARRERDLGALARRGFELDVARRVVDARDASELPEPRTRAAFD